MLGAPITYCWSCLICYPDLNEAQLLGLCVWMCDVAAHWRSALIDDILMIRLHYEYRRCGTSNWDTPQGWWKHPVSSIYLAFVAFVCRHGCNDSVSPVNRWEHFTRHPAGCLPNYWMVEIPFYSVAADGSWLDYVVQQFRSQPRRKVKSVVSGVTGHSVTHMGGRGVLVSGYSEPFARLQVFL